jgi:hypothetical protein
MKTIDENEQLNNKPQNKWKKYGWIIFIISVIYIFNKATEDYCFKEKRKLSDDEFILITLDKLIKSGEMKLNNLDNTPEKYHKQHPGCCRVYDKEHISEGFKHVSVVYELSDKKKEIRKVQKYKYIGIYNACGFEYDSTGSFDTEY